MQLKHTIILLLMTAASSPSLAEDFLIPEDDASVRACPQIAQNIDKWNALKRELDAMGNGSRSGSADRTAPCADFEKMQDFALIVRQDLKPCLPSSEPELNESAKQLDKLIHEINDAKQRAVELSLCKR